LPAEHAGASFHNGLTGAYRKGAASA
jgi:hypothetical protein